MLLYYIAILSIVQGLTEFLPVSSSGHLVLTHAVMGGSESLTLEQRRLLDVAVHVGTLLSVLLYFRRDVLQMIQGVFLPSQMQGRHLAFKVIISSVPVIIVGFLLHKMMPDWLGSLWVMAWMTLIFGVVLWVADRYAPVHRRVEDLTFAQAFLIGIGQCLALIPGVSRSGITMTCARGFGLSATQAARYSLLLAVVAISGAGTLGGLDLIGGDYQGLSLYVVIAVGLSFISGWLAIAAMMALLERVGFLPFVIYRIGLGLALLGLLHFGIIA